MVKSDTRVSLYYIQRVPSGLNQYELIMREEQRNYKKLYIHLIG